MRKSAKNRSEMGVTLIEMLVNLAVVSITGVVVFYILNIGLTLFAKNTAVNLAHQEARSATIQIEQDIHSAVSIPELVDSSRAVVTGTGPSAGLSFQLLAGTPDHNMFRVFSNVAAGANQVVVSTGTAFRPVVGERLIIPAYQIEQDISAVSVTGTNATVTLSGSGVGTAIVITSGSSAGSFNVLAFFTNRVAYVVQNGALNYYPSLSGTSYSTLSRDITNSLPFNIPTSASGAMFNRFVAATNLKTADPTSSNRGYKATNILINSQVPYRARATVYQ